MQAHGSTTTFPQAVKPATILLAFLAVAAIAVGAISPTRMDRAGLAPTGIGPAEAGSRVALEVSGELTISLPANPSTGYSWVVSSINPAVLAQVGEPEFSAQSDLAGAGGTMTFHFTGIAMGQDSLQLDYVRPWEDGEAPLDTYTVTVNVR